MIKSSITEFEYQFVATRTLNLGGTSAGEVVRVVASKQVPTANSREFILDFAHMHWRIAAGVRT